MRYETYDMRFLNVANQNSYMLAGGKGFHGDGGPFEPVDPIGGISHNSRISFKRIWIQETTASL